MSQIPMYPGLMASQMAAAYKPQPGMMYANNPTTNTQTGQTTGTQWGPSQPAQNSGQQYPGTMQTPMGPAPVMQALNAGQQFQQQGMGPSTGASPQIRPPTPLGIAPPQQGVGSGRGQVQGGITGVGMGGMGGPLRQPGQVSVDGNIQQRLAGQPPTPPGNPGGSQAQQAPAPPQFNNTGGSQRPNNFSGIPPQPQNTQTASQPQYNPAQGAASPPAGLPPPPQLNQQQANQPQPQQQSQYQTGGSFGVPQSMQMLNPTAPRAQQRPQPVSNFNPTQAMGPSGPNSGMPAGMPSYANQSGGYGNFNMGLQAPGQQAAANPAFQNTVQQNYLRQMAAPGHGMGGYGTGFNP